MKKYDALLILALLTEFLHPKIVCPGENGCGEYIEGQCTYCCQGYIPHQTSIMECVFVIANCLS